MSDEVFLVEESSVVVSGEIIVDVIAVAPSGSTIFLSTLFASKQLLGC